VLLHVAPPLIVYCDIIAGRAHKWLSCTKPLPQGMSNLKINEEFTWATFHSCFCTITKYATPLGHWNYHFSGNTPQWNQSQLDFFSTKLSSTFQFLWKTPLELLL